MEGKAWLFIIAIIAILVLFGLVNAGSETISMDFDDDGGGAITIIQGIKFNTTEQTILVSVDKEAEAIPL
jgi:hypothetical protein